MSVVSHISMGFNREDTVQMVKFYDAVMEALGARRQIVVLSDGSKIDDFATWMPEEVSKEETTKTSDDGDEPPFLAAIAYGKYYPQIWITLPHDRKPATVGNGTHLALSCTSAEHVERVYEAALANGGTDNGKPGPRIEYSEKYHGGFFLDPAGNKLEATFFDLGIFNYCAIL